eukprot:COSAG01_NODE_75099_length_198_cov_48.858586_1_plen_36_part_10
MDSCCDNPKNQNVFDVRIDVDQTVQHIICNICDKEW